MTNKFSMSEAGNSHMFRPEYSLRAKCIAIALYVSLFVIRAEGKVQAERDPHRPPCADPYCRKVKSFVKKHYCGESPFGNGPDDGCDIKPPKKPGATADVKATFKCAWSVSKQAAQCEQRGQPSSVVRNLLIHELRKVGLPLKANGQIYFTVWESTPSGWTVAEAYYSRSVGTDIELCQVILFIDKNSRAIVLRKLPFQKTDVDKPMVIQWSLIDLADAGDDGQVDIVLEGDAYEDHWIEVISLKHGSAQTVFSGLGYWL